MNYVPGGQNMLLSDDAQIVQGVSGNACYLPAGIGRIKIAGNRNEVSVSLWRQWDGVVEADYVRGVFSFKNMQVFFDNKSDFLTIVLNGFKAITDVKDDQKQAHWCFVFAKNNFFKVYKNAEKVYELAAGPASCDFSDGFTLGGGRTHAAFDEVRLYKSVLKQNEIEGLYRLVSKGTHFKQLEKLIEGTTPKYLGVTETVAATRTAIITKGERLGAVDANAGDWVLSGKTIGGWKVGVCYRWTGTLWINLEPEANYAKEYHACLLHICEIEELMKETGHFGALFAKVLVAQKAMIDELLVNQAFIKNLVVRKLKIDTDETTNQDFEAWFDETNGLKIRNNKKTLLHLDPVAGHSVFNGDIKANKIFLNKQNQDEGVVEAVNNDWKLVIQPCPEGLELSIMGGDGGFMQKKQLYTYISGGLMSLAVMGNISCSKMFSSQVTFDSWQKIEIPTTQYYDGTTNIFDHQNTIVLTTNTKEIFTSSDNGVIWKKTTDLLADPRKFDIIKAGRNDEYILTIGSENNKNFLFKSKDFGITWDNTNIEADTGFYEAGDVFILKNRDLYKVSSNFLDKEKIYTTDITEFIDAVYSNKKIWVISIYNYAYITKSCLCFSADKGKTWHKRLQGYNFSIAFSPNSVFVGNNEGVKKSLDGGVTWTTISTEKPASLFYIDKYLIVLPHENKGGIFISDNEGSSFSFISCGYQYKLHSMATTPISRIITTTVIGTTSGVKKAVLLVNKNKQFF